MNFLVWSWIGACTPTFNSWACRVPLSGLSLCFAIRVHSPLVAPNGSNVLRQPKVGDLHLTPQLKACLAASLLQAAASLNQLETKGFGT